MSCGAQTSLLLAGVLLGALDVSRASGQDAVSLAPQGRQPRAAVNAEGVVAVVYGQGDEIFCRISRDAGASYDEPTRIGTLERLMLGMRRGPQLAAAGSSFVVTAIGRQGDIASWRSADGGRSWSGPTTVNDRATTAREGLHAIAADGGIVHVVWLDLRDGRTKIFRSRSSDQGRTWDANHRIYESPDGTVCECCQPTVAADGGEVVVMWRNSLAGARDMFLVRSSDRGRSFGEAQKLGKETWPLRACPMDGGGVAVQSGRIATVWRREETVYSVVPGAEETSLGRGRNGAVALGPRGASLAWQSADGEIMLQEPGSPAPAAVARGRFPSFGTAPFGKGPIVLVWEDPERGAMTRRLSPR